MKTTHSKIVASLVLATVFCFLAVEFAEARRGGGRGGGRSMMRGGPAASGSMHRQRARPSRSTSGRSYSGSRPQRDSSRDFNRDSQRYDQRQQNRQDNAGNREERRDERQQRNDERWDQRQENIDERQDFAREVHNDREEWYEDRWRGGTYISVSTWGTMGCSYNRVIVNGITYYDCNGVRYERVYRGSEVVYVVVN